MLDSATNGLAHSNGVISMANSGPNTDGSQFFLTATNVPDWDGSYTAFGNVVSGQTVVAEIADVPVQGAGFPACGGRGVEQRDHPAGGRGGEGLFHRGQHLPAVGSAPGDVLAAYRKTRRGSPWRLPRGLRFCSDLANGLISWQTEDWGYFTNDEPHVVEVERRLPMSLLSCSCVSYSMPGPRGSPLGTLAHRGLEYGSAHYHMGCSSGPCPPVRMFISVSKEPTNG
jgi:hypothetical protein